MDEQNTQNPEEKRAIRDVREMIELAFSAIIETSPPLEDDQIDALDNLSQYCVSAALQTPEVIRHPLKVVYKANEEMKDALVAICLSYSLINPRRKLSESKDFFSDNITIFQHPGNIKFVDFGRILPSTVQAAIDWDIVEDWKLYHDKECGGIRALVDEKTNLTGLENYVSGGDRSYEFARFQRKYTEKSNAQEQKSKIAAEDAFRNAVMQSVATEVTRQQLLEGKNPMDIIDSLLGKPSDRQTPQIERRSGSEQRQLSYSRKQRSRSDDEED